MFLLFMLQSQYKVVQSERFSMVLTENLIGYFSIKIVSKNNGNNRETVNSSFILVHPLCTLRMKKSRVTSFLRFMEDTA